MLQALKLDAPTTAPPRPREPESTVSDLEAGFAAFLAQAAWVPSVPAPPPPAPPEPAKSASSASARAVEGPDRSGSRPQPLAPAKTSDARSEAPEPTREPEVEAPASPAGSETREAAESEGTGPSDPSDSTPGKAPTEARTAGAHAPAPTDGGAIPSSPAPATQALVPAAPGEKPRTPAPREAGPSASAPAPTASRSSETPDPRLRVEPEAARTWSATGTALRPLQEFLAQPRPPLETPAPLRETTPAPAPPHTPPGAAAASTEGARPLAEEVREAAPLPAQALAASRTPTPGRETQARGTGSTLPTAGVMAVRATVAPDSPQPTGPSSRAPLPVLQVEGSIRWMIQNRQRGAELHLHPETLGRVTIRLTVEGTEVHARIWASEASTLPLLQEHRLQLEQALRGQGLNLGSFDLNQGSRGDASQEPGRPLADPGVPARAEATASQQDLPTSAPVLPGGARLLEVFA